MTRDASNTTVLWPARVDSMAAAKPAQPAPMMAIFIYSRIAAAPGQPMQVAVCKVWHKTQSGKLACHIQTRPSACTFQANHILRNGVRLMRWCSTAKLSCSISLSSVR